MSIYHDIRQVLTAGGIELGEAQAIAFMLLEDVRGMSRAEALMCEDADEELMQMARRIADGEPVQYVVGKAWFCGMEFSVAPGVLIPRPETEELVELVTADSDSLSTSISDIGLSPVRILDIGTGSGCIAISLAKRFPEAKVEAWDVSDEALEIAKKNAAANGVDVLFRNIDVLSPQLNHLLQLPQLNHLLHLNQLPQISQLNHLSHLPQLNSLDVIVSNPPYICNKEKADMESHVLDHEPHLALFVPDDDPLLFYRRIAEIGLVMLRSGGRLYYEINRQYGRDTVQMLENLGYKDIALLQDQFGNDRMVKAIKC